ncbi:SoxR reducing system RseC family protein [Parasalinivibrio latis]|uniref:SoxR reducing system RseC family protein n=1 Tax=Parasalinivibrio latis TaxID=2952610 RepID=UPI0030E20723
MITAVATVVKAEKGEILLSCRQQSSCGSCASQSSCGTGIVSKALPGRDLSVSVASDKNLSPGTQVEIGLTERSVLGSAMLVYLVPLFGLIAGTALGQFLSNLIGAGEGVIILCALLFAAAGLFLARSIARKRENESHLKPVLLRVLGTPVDSGLAINAASEDSD